MSYEISYNQGVNGRLFFIQLQPAHMKDTPELNAFRDGWNDADALLDELGFSFPLTSYPFLPPSVIFDQVKAQLLLLTEDERDRLNHWRKRQKAWSK